MHESPDGDTLSAASAIFQFLKKTNKKPVMACIDPVPSPFLFLPDIDQIQSDLLFGDFELILVIDCGDSRRTGFPDRLKKFSKSKKPIINIDHHPKNDLHKIATINYVDYKVSSTSEIVWNFLRQIEFPIDKEIATALFCGLYTDTGGFKHSNTSPKTLEIAGELLKLGARSRLVNRSVSLNKSIPTLKLWGIALSRLNYNYKTNVVSSMITAQDVNDCRASASDIAGVVNLINSVPEAKASILFYENGDGKIKASLRTEDNKADVSRLAAIFGGGGHKKAAGFTVDGSLKINKNNWQIVLD